MGCGVREAVRGRRGATGDWARGFENSFKCCFDR